MLLEQNKRIHPSPFADQIFGKVEIWGFSGGTPPRLRLWVNMGHFGTCSWIDRDKKSRLSSIRTTRWTNATHFFVFCPLSLGQMVHAILCLRVDHIVDKHDTFFILLISFFLWSWVKYFSQFFVSMWWTPLWCQTPLWKKLTFLWSFLFDPRQPHCKHICSRTFTSCISQEPIFCRFFLPKSPIVQNKAAREGREITVLVLGLTFPPASTCPQVVSGAHRWWWWPQVEAPAPASTRQDCLTCFAAYCMPITPSQSPSTSPFLRVRNNLDFFIFLNNLFLLLQNII